jgi:hypothetical protein
VEGEALLAAREGAFEGGVGFAEGGGFAGGLGFEEAGVAVIVAGRDSRGAFHELGFFLAFSDIRRRRFPTSKRNNLHEDTKV